MVSLRRERRRAERRWIRIGSGVARTLYVSARRALVKQIYICKIEYYQHQMSQCDGDQQRTFVFLNNLMGRTLDPALPTSFSDDELASRFSDFFSEIIRIKRETDESVVNQEFSVDFPLRFTRSFTFSHFRSVTEADVLGYIRETRKMLFSYKNIYHYTYRNTYIALYFSYAKVTCNTHKNKKLLSIPLKLVPSLAKLPLPYFPPSTGRSASSHSN